MRHLNQEQFEHHINKFKRDLGVELYGTHAIIGNVVVPTVRTELMSRKTDGTDNYFMHAYVPGEEGNLHHMSITNMGPQDYYGLNLYGPADEHEFRNFDTYDLSEFERGVYPHLAKAHSDRPNDILWHGLYQEWHRQGQLRAVEVSDWEKTEGATRVYDPVTQKYV